jgi:hypothetical protein
MAGDEIMTLDTEVDSAIKLSVPPEGSLTVHLDGMKQAIKAMSEPELARFVANGIQDMKRLLSAAEAAVLGRMLEDGVSEIPVGDGRTVEVHDSVKYKIDWDKLDKAQDAFKAAGIDVVDELGEPLANYETVKHNADVRKLRKAMKWGGEGARLVEEALQEDSRRQSLRVKGEKRASKKATTAQILEGIDRAVKEVSEDNWGAGAGPTEVQDD